MLIDTHCHLDAAEFADDRDAMIKAALASGVKMMVVPAVEAANFQTVIDLSHDYSAIAYALGIHPMYIDGAVEADLAQLKALIAQQLNHKLVAVGEIGLDFFATTLNREKQEYFFAEQLKIARTFDLPVILHVRQSSDIVLKHLRKIKVRGGIAHAFNGSRQQADAFIKLGFKLGFGGAMTYTRALHIRDLAKSIPLESIVLETDSPDIPPAWLRKSPANNLQNDKINLVKPRNTPAELKQIAQVLSEIRSENVAQIVVVTGFNACQVLPKLASLCT